MKKFFCAALILCTIIGFSQPTSYTFKFELPPNDFVTNMQWADVDNDSLLDVVIGYKGQSSFIVSAFLNKKTEPWPIQTIVTTSYSDQINFMLNDVNKDNKLDVVVLNEVDFLVRYYNNESNMAFTPGIGWGSREVFNKGLQFADINNDGTSEIIFTDGATLSIINNLDTALQSIQSFQALDLDLNGFRDLIFSGVDINAKPLTFIWYFGNNFKIINRIKVADVSGQIATGDVNHDGYFDVIISGKDVNGNLITRLFQNNKSSFSPSSSYYATDASSIKIADFDNDGLADVSLFGNDLNNNTVNIIQFYNYSNSLPSANVSHQDFGDYDRDGDLDIAMITDSLEVTNQNPGLENTGPSIPTQAIGFQVFDRMFFYWDKSSDDHTPDSSITYDLKVFDTDSIIIASDFNSETKHRLTVSHGNMGTNNFSLQKLQGSYNFEVQSIDNAFATIVTQGSCSGACICSGVCSPCVANLDQQDIVACSLDTIKLVPPAANAMWFSFKYGFVGIADEYDFNPVETDTIFSFNPTSNASCANLRVFNIIVNPTDTLQLSHTRFDCLGRNITLEVGPEWNSVTWKNNLNTNVVNQPSFVHAINNEIIITAYASNDYGCKLKEEFILKKSKPDLQVNGNHFQIMRGTDVQLIATGGNLYEWSPASSLNNGEISNPIASPDETTEYVVTAYDSLGCTSEAKILVEVFEEAFIPTLFTPNDDGRNDNLKIYGLSHASGFRFAIYNREGSKLFETTSIQEATGAGWTGAVNGIRQPPGTYYWKVEGKMPKGELLLNGKNSGVVLLVR